MTKKQPAFNCALCGRKLRGERWIYSKHTGNRFCFPGECKKRRTVSTGNQKEKT